MSRKKFEMIGVAIQTAMARTMTEVRYISNIYEMQIAATKTMQVATKVAINMTVSRCSTLPAPSRAAEVEERARWYRKLIATIKKIDATALTGQYRWLVTDFPPE